MTWSDGGGLRNCNAAAFASFKKYPLTSDFLNLACGVTEPKDAAYAVTGLKSNHNSQTTVSGNAFAPYLVILTVHYAN